MEFYKLSEFFSNYIYFAVILSIIQFQILYIIGPQTLQLGSLAKGGERIWAMWVAGWHAHAQLDLHKQWVDACKCLLAHCSRKLNCPHTCTLASHSCNPILNRSRPSSRPWPRDWRPLLYFKKSYTCIWVNCCNFYFNIICTLIMITTIVHIVQFAESTLFFCCSCYFTTGIWCKRDI